MEWQDKLFQALEIDELYELIKLRVDVFVVEQDCPYPELDGRDRHEKTIHFMGKDNSGKIVAYLRILPPGLSFTEVSIGRVVVAGTAREKGVCNEMMHRALKRIASVWPQENVRISAQVYLKDFYETHGFKPVSNSYLEDGIPHIDMLKI